MKKNPVESLARALFLATAMVAVAAVAAITFYLVAQGVPAIAELGLKKFLLGERWAPTSERPEYGILPFLLTSAIGTAAAVLLALPVGILTALYAEKVAPKPVARAIGGCASMLSGIPSVIFGLVGMLVLVPAVMKAFSLSDGSSLFCAAIVLAVMALPSVIKVSQTSIAAVPKEYEDASLALGATKTETLFRVTLPAAKSGIAAAAALATGRAIGESMAVMMVSGNAANMPRVFGSVRFLTTAVASEMSYSSGFHRQALFSIALVLFAFIMAINAALGLFFKPRKKR